MSEQCFARTWRSCAHCNAKKNASCSPAASARIAVYIPIADAVNIAPNESHSSTAHKRFQQCYMSGKIGIVPEHISVNTSHAESRTHWPLSPTSCISGFCSSDEHNNLTICHNCPPSDRELTAADTSFYATAFRGLVLSLGLIVSITTLLGSLSELPFTPA